MRFRAGLARHLILADGHPGQSVASAVTFATAQAIAAPSAIVEVGLSNALRDIFP